jgi:Domain of unknown function (DUF4234)
MTADRGQLLLGKNRNPFAVIFFSIITLGVYWFVWVYKVNNEVRKHEPLVHSSPGVSVFAQFIPIANFISDYNLASRIHRMELADQSTNQISPVVTIVLLFFFGIGYVFQIQSHLNAHWDGHRFAVARAAQQLPSQPSHQALPVADVTLRGLDAPALVPEQIPAVSAIPADHSGDQPALPPVLN